MVRLGAIVDGFVSREEVDSVVDGFVSREDVDSVVDGFVSRFTSSLRWV